MMLDSLEQELQIVRNLQVDAGNGNQVLLWKYCLIPRGGF